MGFNWWEALGAGVGIVGGAALGTLVGNPIGGAAVGFGIGTAVSPGGFWNEDPEALRKPDSAGITAAAMSEMNAADVLMRRNIAVGTQDIRNRFGAAGTFQSGARGQAEDRFREQSLRNLSGAFAGIELEAIRAHQGAEANALAINMQQAQLSWQKQQQENAMISSIIEVGLPFILDSKGAGSNAPALNPMKDMFLAEQNLQFNDYQDSLFNATREDNWARYQQGAFPEIQRPVGGR